MDRFQQVLLERFWLLVHNVSGLAFGYIATVFNVYGNISHCRSPIKSVENWSVWKSLQISMKGDRFNLLIG